uniref:Uncharacterized protein n=1 Tax=Paramormyrops kingsleyae TaxID=1676925 RepID=A0A3B3S9Q9_9TELE
MAEASDAVDQNQFCCPICLDLLKDPVAIPCRHSYCMSCIKSCWDQEDHAGVYSCPQCRQTFVPRPVLGRNIILAEVVKKLKKTGLQADTPVDHYAGPGDVECDVCTGRKHKAVKSCLVCLASYCETDLQLHNKLHHAKQHKVIDAISCLQDKVCSHHDKPLEVYCRTDQQCICYLCTMDEHRGHDTVSAAAGWAEKQKQMGETQREFQQRIQMREKELLELREAVGSFTSSAQSTVEDSERIFTEMIRSIERRRSEVTQLIRDQEMAAVSQAEGDMERLKQEIDELKRRHSELEQLSHTEDHIHFLQSIQMDVCLYLYFKLFVVCQKFIKSFLSIRLQFTFVLMKLFNQSVYSCQLTLDPNTANNNLHLSEGNRVVTWKRETQLNHDYKMFIGHQGRSDTSQQVLCIEGLTERCYWEVEWSGNGVGIGVTYKGISRKGWVYDSRLGYNDKSWCLSCSTSSYLFRHNNMQTSVSGPSPRIGVYLDHKEGTLSFYSVSDTMTLLQKVQTTFTKPLYPGFKCNGNSAVQQW